MVQQLCALYSLHVCAADPPLGAPPIIIFSLSDHRPDHAWPEGEKILARELRGSGYDVRFQPALTVITDIDHLRFNRRTTVIQITKKPQNQARIDIWMFQSSPRSIRHSSISHLETKSE